MRRIDEWRAWAAQRIAPPAQKNITEKIHVCGLIRAREVPFATEEEWRYWWLPERNESGTIIRSARMSEREKERYTAAEAPNILVSSGITQVLTYIGSATGNTTGFAKYFAVGNVGITTVESNDTSLANEYYRVAPSTSNISGVQIDISSFFGASNGNGNITNAGLFGGSATATLLSGTLMTKSLFKYTKVNGIPITVDYLISYA